MVLIMHFAFKRDTTSSAGEEKERGRTQTEDKGGDEGNEDQGPTVSMAESVAHFYCVEFRSGGSLK